MTIFYCCLRFETPPTCRAGSPYLYPPGTGWPGGRRRKGNPVRGGELEDDSSASITQETQPLYCFRCVFTGLLHSNGRGAYHIENTVLLLSHTCKLRALPRNGRCLPSHYLVTGLNGRVFLFFIGTALDLYSEGPRFKFR
jgi:hypothetical protein